MSTQDHTQYLNELAYKWLKGSISKEEKKYFENWYASLDDTEVILNDWQYKNKFQLKNKIQDSIKEKIAGDIRAVKVKRRRKIAFYAATAAIIFIALWIGKIDFSTLLSSGESRYANDIPPGKNTATLTLASGKTIILSSAYDKVDVSGGALHYGDGSLVSDDQFKVEKIVARTPKAGTYQVVLNDGTRVWLNASSSIEFPSSFAKSAKRVVEVTGEAYLEVAKDSAHPFIVKTLNQEIAVLGTHFNINSYADEPAVKTTLLEGRVKVNAKGFRQEVLLPGEQSVLAHSSLSVREVDTASVVAWKNGYFKFNNENLESIMLKLARWYNIDVSYQADLQQEKFTGRISRNKRIGQVLKLMESGKSIKFKVEGRRVTVIQ